MLMIYLFICIGINHVNRLVCSTIERGYAPSEAREIRAMASFHNPNGFLYGYIRMVCIKLIILKIYSIYYYYLFYFCIF